MCLVRVDGRHLSESGQRELTAEEWIHLAETVCEAGTLNLLLTGGEVMLRPDFCEIYEAIAKMGFMTTLYTNATLLTPQILSLLRRYPPHKIGVTMYGASNETYQALCGCRDGYDRFIHGVRELMTLPSLLDIRTTIVKANAMDLPAMQAYAKELFGAPERLHISRFVCKAVRGGVCRPEEVRLSPEENIASIEKHLLDLNQQFSEDDVLQRFFSPRKMRAVTNVTEGGYLFEACHAGLDSYMINWAGKMYACELLDRGFTEPLREGFEEAWNRLPEVYPPAHTIEKCKDCKFSVTCETCPANRLAETGDWFGIPEYACREARLRYKLLSKIGIVE